jgi:hypothetical protein
MPAVYFSIDENADGLIQLSIEREGIGYRICGPKYDGRGRTIKKHKLTAADVKEIRSFLSSVRSPQVTGLDDAK